MKVCLCTTCMYFPMNNGICRCLCEKINKVKYTNWGSIDDKIEFRTSCMEYKKDWINVIKYGYNRH